MTDTIDYLWNNCFLASVYEPMKRSRKKIVLIVFTLLLVFLAWKPAFVYHIPVGPPVYLKAEIKYQLVDFFIDIRTICEYRTGNVRIFLNDDKIKWLYVDADDKKKLWPESPFVMKEKNYTIIATFKVTKALFGNFTLAKVVDTTHVTSSPLIQK